MEDRINTHNYVRDTLYNEFSRHIHIFKNIYLIPGSIRRPGDVSVTGWSLGKADVIDLAITSPLQNSNLKIV